MWGRTCLEHVDGWYQQSIIKGWRQVIKIIFYIIYKHTVALIVAVQLPVSIHTGKPFVLGPISEMVANFTPNINSFVAACGVVLQNSFDDVWEWSTIFPWGKKSEESFLENGFIYLEDMFMQIETSEI